MSSIKGPIKRVGEELQRETSRPNQAPADAFVRLVHVNRMRSKNTAKKKAREFHSAQPADGFENGGIDHPDRRTSDWKQPPGLLSPTRPILRLENRLQAGRLSRIAYYSFLLITSKIFIPCWKIIFVQAIWCPSILPQAEQHGTLRREAEWSLTSSHFNFKVEKCI